MNSYTEFGPFSTTRVRPMTPAEFAKEFGDTGVKPYQRQILETLEDARVERVAVNARRVGKTAISTAQAFAAIRRDILAVARAVAKAEQRRLSLRRQARIKGRPGWKRGGRAR